MMSIYDGKIELKMHAKKLIIYVFIIITACLISVVKYQDGDINFIDSDASYHTLLTLVAYDETPVNIHHYLPIVTLGDEEDKGIEWGSTIPDRYGNYYYTSFSPAGFALPYFFIKLFGLEISLRSLYLFNSFLYIISAFLVCMILFGIFHEEEKHIQIFLCTLMYLCSIEIMHGMGIVYWHQSLFQVCLLFQILAYVNVRKTKTSKILFYAMCLINPYIEWTGYISNLGFVIGELFSGSRIDNEDIRIRKNKCISAIVILILTGLSFGAFCLHFLSVVDLKDFVKAIIMRFGTRSIVKASIIDLIKGYVSSYSFLWIGIIVAIILNCVLYRGISWIKESFIIREKVLFLVVFFPALENIVMMQHAVQYTYDRMKLAIPLVIIMFDLLKISSRRTKGVKYYRSVAVITMLLCICNVFQYRTTKSYIYDADYLQNNNQYSVIVSEQYPRSDCVMGASFGVRGYINLLFNRGIYENTNLNEMICKAKERNKRYALLLSTDKPDKWGMMDISSMMVADLTNNVMQSIKISGGTVQKEIINGYEELFNDPQNRIEPLKTTNLIPHNNE